MRPGEEVSLVCESSASVPEASLTWKLHQSGHTVQPNIKQVT
jgi:hypothetical protein